MGSLLRTVLLLFPDKSWVSASVFVTREIMTAVNLVAAPQRTKSVLGSSAINNFAPCFAVEVTAAAAV